MGGSNHGSGSLTVSDMLFGPPAAATMAGALEIMVFHPFDTVAKRLMSHTEKVVKVGDISQTLRNADGVLFKGLAPEKKHLTGRVAHLYPGSKWAIAYKVSQRVVKFAGQPFVRDHLYRGGKDETFRKVFGAKGGKLMLEASAGAFVGVCECVLLPFDRMKVLSQVNSGAVGNRGFVEIIRTEGIATMYAGCATTAVRNMSGSFLLFFGTCVTKDFVFGLEDYKKATFLQNTISSTIGACMGVIFTSPMDVIKTRIQNKSFGTTTSGAALVMEVLKTEGASAFYKGITPKVATSAPKLVFSYTMTEYFVKRLRGNQQARLAKKKAE